MNGDRPIDDERTVRLPGCRSAVREPAGQEDGIAPGTRLGRYRIEALLGRGGMGEVYLAEQLQPVRRRVALKLLRGRRLDARGLGHVEIEQQMLAQMRHPAIAQIYDAGVTAGGDPYFAMEYIEGSPLTAFCKDHALPLRVRIELFIRICEGVEHAHHKGVVHRDLKPANILVAEVDGRPLPRIIDFGIATAAARGGDDGDGTRAGTPSYMSPEQVGDPASVDTRSDVYALGVLLYEIVAGERPPTGAAAAGDCTPLHDALRGELGCVVRKAMHHERDARYGSAAALADDLRRFLEDRPLQAVPHSRRYVWRKLARRHRVGIAAGTAIAIAVLAGLGLSLYGLVQAQRQRVLVEQRGAKLEKVVAFQQQMLEGVDVEAMGIALADGLRDQVGRADPQALPGLEERLALASTVDLARSLMGGQVLAQAEEVIARDFAAEPALAADLRASLGRVYAALGMPGQAATHYGRVLAWREDVLGRGAVETLDVRSQLARALRESARHEEGRSLLEESLDAALVLADDSEVRARYELELAELEGEQGDLAAARERKQAVLDRLRLARGATDPLTGLASDRLAMTMARMGELAEARELMEELYAWRLDRYGADHRDTLAAASTLAALRAMLSDTEAALELQQHLARAQAGRLGREHPVTLVARGNLANMLSASGRGDEALREAAAVYEARGRVLGPEHPQTLRALLNLSSFHARLDDFETALPLERQVIEARSRILGPRHPDTLFIQINHGMTLARAGLHADSQRVLEPALADAEEVLGERHQQFRNGMLFLGQARLMLGQAPAAVEVLRDTLRMQRQHLPPDAPDIAWTAWMLVRALHADGRGQEALALQEQALAPLLAADPDSLGVALRNRRAEILAAMEEAGLAMR